MPGIMLMGEWALKFIWCAWCAWCAWCTWCDWCGWCDWCPFIFPCSSARRTVSACVLPSGITLFSADMASCASSRLLNLCRELFDQLEWIQCVVVCDSKKQMWMFCFFFTWQMQRHVDCRSICRAEYSSAQWCRICRKSFPNDLRLWFSEDLSHTNWYLGYLRLLAEHMKPLIVCCVSWYRSET